MKFIFGILLSPDRYPQIIHSDFSSDMNNWKTIALKASIVIMVVIVMLTG
ncbi:MAG: hypothetical protein ACNA8K_04540 [Cyclonatronaceae bacterium]